jgi:1-deoxy-D-xylulose-5-phosphate reductoisomerase
MHGDEGLEAVATHREAQTVVTGVVGFLGLKPTAAAIRKGKTIALANKETLVAAGAAIMPMVRQFGATIVPVDSEHSAIFQSLTSYTAKEVSRLWLTASGGPFRTWTREQIENATIDDALKHPNWSMGPKITIDSATLMNKGLEIIEAHWLFDVPAMNVRVVVHPQSILHSAVEFVDGSIVGQLGVPDMRLPIHYALFYPERVPSERVPRLDLTQLSQLTFEEPDFDRFPCLALARSIAGERNTAACVLNAANEVVVDAFLKGHIKFIKISEQIERVLSRHNPVPSPTLDDILEADAWARREAESLLKAVAS